MWLAQLPLVALAAEPALRATQVRWLAESDEPVWPRVLQANLTTTGTTMTTTEGNLTVVAPREITQEEIMGVAFAGAALLVALLVHLLMFRASYRVNLLMAANLKCLGKAAFSWLATLLQWVMLVALLVPIGLIAAAAQQVAGDSWRLASLGSLIAATLYFGSLALGRLVVDSFYFSWFALTLGLITFFTFGGFFCQFVWVVEPFNFTATSVVMLTVSAVPSICLAFLLGRWQSSRHVLAFLAKEEELRPASPLPQKKWKKICLIIFLFLVELGILGVYGTAVYMLDQRPEVRNVGFVLVIGVVILDLMVWHVWYLGLVKDAAQTAVLMLLARVSACVWGENYWLMGHSGVFIAMVILVGYVTVDMLAPAPDSPKLRRQHAAATILKTLQAKTSGIPETAGEAGGAAEEVEEAPKVEKKRLPLYLHPGWLVLALLILFGGEVALVTLRFELPKISLCNTCDAREQQYFAGVALGIGLVFVVSLFCFRKSQHRAIGLKGPLLETAPISLVIAYATWVAVAVYTSWVVDSWAVLVHVAFLPLIAGLFFSAHYRWVVDDFHLGPPRKKSDSKMAKVVPSDAPADPDGPGAGDGAGPSDAAEGAAATGSSDGVEEKNCLQKIPWTVRIWTLSLLLAFAYGGVLHVVSEERFRWVGWSVAASVLVLGLTFMSNRLWFGTLQLDRAQPILWGFIVLILIAWALLVWYFAGDMELDYFAVSLLGVVFLYPAAYAVLLGLQVLRDAGWSPKDPQTWRFVRNAIIVSAVVYSIFLILIAFAFWPVTLCGFCLLFMVAILGGAFIHWERNNRFIPRKVKIGLALVLGLFILGAAGGITYYFQSLFGGFSAVCIGLVLLLLGAGLLEVSDAQQRTALEQLRIGSSDFVFPLYRFRSGELATAQRDLVSFLLALSVSATWGLVAAAVLDDWPSVGMITASLSVMAALILVAHFVSFGGRQRALLLRSLAPKELYAAVREALSSGDSRSGPTVEDDPSKKGEAVTEDAQETQQELITALQKFRSSCADAMSAYKDQVKIACAGRFNTLPPLAFFHMLNAGVAAIRKGQGCVALTTPGNPKEEHQKLLEAYRSRLSSVRDQQRFYARLQLCLVSAQAQQLWAKESEFRAFLQSTGTSGKGMTMDDFKQLPESERLELEEAWQAWKVSEAEQRKREEQARKEEEEAARKRKEEAQKRKLKAKQDLEELIKSCGKTKKIQDAINQCFAAGLSDADDVVGKAVQRVKELEAAEQLLQEVLQSEEETKGQIEKLKDAVARGNVAGLESELMEKAKQKAEAIRVAVAAREEEERKKKEAERLRKLEEEARKRREEKEEERKRKLEAATKELQEALRSEDDTAQQVEKLQAAIDQAIVAGLEGELVEQAKSRIDEIKLMLTAAEEEERKRKEEERRRKLEEEAEKRRKEAEEERRRKEEEERRKRGGKPKVVAADLENLKKQVKDGDFTDAAWPPEAWGDEAHDPEYKIERLRKMRWVDKVQLFEDGCHPSDIHQGELGDCWFLSAIACVSAAEERKGTSEPLKDVFTYVDPAVGLYVVRFYKNGVYQDVVVDDQFPTKYGQCAFAKSGKRSEAWVQVIEKAYAKLHGTFDAIEGGWVNDGLVDLTGGMGHQIGLKSASAQKEINDGTMWATLKGLAQDGHLLGCGSGAGKDTDISSMGIVKGHAYSLLRVEEVEGHRLVQLRNPWGNTEWKGKWSDVDEDSWTQKMVKKLDYSKDANDGTFWMAFEDFVLHYRNVYVCRVFSSDWQRGAVDSEWRGETAGGCSNNRSKYEKNPRVLLKVVGRVKLFLTLMQHDSRGSGEGDGEVPIGFAVYKHSDKKLRDRVCDTGSYCYDREVYIDKELTETNSSGPSYVLVPTTFKAGQERAFTMKVYWKGDPTAVAMWLE